jgi:hypothetical protein
VNGEVSGGPWRTTPRGRPPAPLHGEFGKLDCAEEAQFRPGGRSCAEYGPGQASSWLGIKLKITKQEAQGLPPVNVDLLDGSTGKQ